MGLAFNPEACLCLPAAQAEILVSHCRRKLNGLFLPGETREPKAFGLLAGMKADRRLVVHRTIPLIRNVRDQEPYRGLMDAIMAAHAVPSETPPERRGWVADPGELAAHLDAAAAAGDALLAIYHMHRVGWPHDPRRDTPTGLDRILADKSGLYQVIVSMVDPGRPRLRAFFEGAAGQEIPIQVVE
ncbi:MAG: hypothetical protein AB1634_13360 [Thermodesulfobacteriota bacterium]